MQENTKKLIDHSIEYAKDLLDTTLEFYPFGAYIDTINNVHPLEFEYDKNNQPTVETVLNALAKYCKTEMAANKMKAYGLTFESEVLLKEGDTPVKCITVEIINSEDDNVPVFYLPYSLNEDGTVAYDELFAVKS
jgi:hypothetical protein